MTAPHARAHSTEVEHLCAVAREHIDARRFGEAEALLMRARSLAPDNPDVHYCFGILWTDLLRPADVLAALDVAISLDDRDAKVHNNRGSALQVLGRLSEAKIAYRHAIVLRPDLAQPYMNLGKVLEQQGRNIDAVAVYDLALARGLDCELFGQYRASALGQSTPRSPATWLKATFDNFAPTFDEHLRALRYDVPNVIASMLRPRARGPMDILDLGCGTGQVGAALSGQGHRIVGVDLSEKMLARARARGVYAELHVAEVTAFLNVAPTACIDAVCAGDVFIYIGDLDGVFSEVARALRSGGLFVFSTEEHTGHDFALLPTGRYAQSDAYIRRLAAPFEIIEARCHTIRMEQGMPIAGRVYLLRSR